MTSSTETRDRDLWPMLIVSASLEVDCTFWLVSGIMRFQATDKTHFYEETC